MLNKKALAVIGAVAVVLLLSSCAASADPSVGTPGAYPGVPGFVMGFWHGFIAIIALVVSIFNPSIGIYEVPNEGLWYNVGFVLGFIVFTGGSVFGAFRR